MKKTFSVIICFVTLIVISAASTSYKPPRFKNLKILPKNISEIALDSIMDHFSISLGVKCGFCHVHNEEKKTWDMASDANPDKLIARKMMLMTNGINIKYFPTEKNTKDQQAIQTITCYTCHKGDAIPISRAETKEEVK
ncbi:MAG TPA: c-type cytochrome [Chitinophagaceae bacterium]|nr:c-type cytochrome [Chitinophagaceae bacterium]